MKCSNWSCPAHRDLQNHIWQLPQLSEELFMPFKAWYGVVMCILCMPSGHQRHIGILSIEEGSMAQLQRQNSQGQLLILTNLRYQDYKDTGVKSWDKQELRFSWNWLKNNCLNWQLAYPWPAVPEGSQGPKLDKNKLTTWREKLTTPLPCVQNNPGIVFYQLSIIEMVTNTLKSLLLTLFPHSWACASCSWPRKRLIADT